MTKNSSNHQETGVAEQATPVTEQAPKTTRRKTKTNSTPKTTVTTKREEPESVPAIDFKAEIAKYQKQIEKQAQTIAQLEEELKNMKADKGLKKLEKKIDTVLSLLEKKDKVKKKKK